MLDKNMKILYQFNSECKSKESQEVGVEFKVAGNSSLSKISSSM
jgi:hypothetical protein